MTIDSKPLAAEHYGDGPTKETFTLSDEFSNAAQLPAVLRQ
jgi:hypothetical protein